MTKIRIGGKYKLRKGNHIRRILAVDVNNINYPVLIEYLDGSTGMRTYEGLASKGRTSYLDLIEIETETWVKSMGQILQENPGWYFDGFGDLYEINKGLILYHNSYSCLGKPKIVSHSWPDNLLYEKEIEDETFS